MVSDNSKILLITPPFTQLNTPYPATAYLKGFLNKQSIASSQLDLGIETILQLFTAETLQTLFSTVSTNQLFTENDKRIFALQKEYITTVDSVISFLQNENPTLAYRIAERQFLPEASRFSQLDELEYSFGNMGVRDQARYFCTLYLEDLGDFMTDHIDPHFGFSRYAERLGRSANTFDEIYTHLQGKESFIENIFLDILNQQIKKSTNLKLVCFSVPFPGNLFSAFRCAQFIKKKFPKMKLAMGGGFANTELRSVSDVRVFEFFDFITLDDGERPVLNLIEFVNGKRNSDQLKRTFLIENNKVVYKNNSDPDFAIRETGTPDYSDLPLKKYLSVIEITNPMHRLWSDGRWNKLTLAHGCYWGKCTFCDISLDYIQRYEPANAKLICDRVEELMAQTNETGFHFVDEAAPPSLLKEFSLEIIRRNLKITWWVNIRFEKTFTADLCKLMAAAGCIAVSGGLEVASDRLLALIEKGVTVPQVAKVTNDFTVAGIKVHAYLMYGYPTQTIQETIDSLEMVRQLFDSGIIQSGFWHRFALTAHSPVAADPVKYKIQILNTSKGSFANNDLEYIEASDIDHEEFSEGLKKSLFNFMNGVGLDFPLQEWFDFSIPKTKVKKDFIQYAIEENDLFNPAPHQKCFWLGANPEIIPGKKSEWIFRNRMDDVLIKLKKTDSDWLEEIWTKLNLNSESPFLFSQMQDSYSQKTGQPFALFLYSDEMEQLREAGLIIV